MAVVRLVLAYIPFAALLLIIWNYGGLAFTSYLLEDQWGSHVTGGGVKSDRFLAAFHPFSRHFDRPSDL